MTEIKSAIAKNITALRLAKGITQIELAQMLNYSDKAVSKWERGESIPDVTVLYKISEIFGVNLDYLVHEHTVVDDSGIKLSDATKKRNRTVITGLSILLVWLISTTVYVILEMVPKFTSHLHSLSFLYAIPATMVVWLIFNSLWFIKRINYVIISLIMWTSLASIYISFLCFGFNFLILFALGVPGQVIIFLWSGIVYPKHNKVKLERKKKE